MMVGPSELASALSSSVLGSIQSVLPIHLDGKQVRRHGLRPIPAVLSDSGLSEVLR
jgi:hypothetical protein